VAQRPVDSRFFETKQQMPETDLFSTLQSRAQSGRAMQQGDQEAPVEQVFSQYPRGSTVYPQLCEEWLCDA